MRRKALFTLAITLLAPFAIAASATKEFHKVVPLDANGRVSLDSHNGTVSIMAWDQARVSIDARIGPADFGGEAEDVQNTNVKVSGGGASLRIESDYSAVENHSWLFGFGTTRSLPPVDYTIRVPATSQLEIEVHNASVKVDGLRNAVEARTHNGSVDMKNLAGGATVETHNGSVRLAFSQFSVPARVETHNGSCDVIVPAATRMSVRTDSHRSDPLSSDLPMIVKAGSMGQSASINGGGPELRFSTHNGSLHLAKR